MNYIKCFYSLQLRQGLLPALHPRTPKLLAPLDGRPRDNAALPVLRHHIPLKPISQSSLCSRARLRRERLSWGSPRTCPLTTKGGSEESGSSSGQSSIDLEDEHDKDQRDTDERSTGESHLKFIGDRLLQHSNDVSSFEANLVWGTTRHVDVHSGTSHIPPIRRSAHHLDEEPINHASDCPDTEKAINSHCEGRPTNIIHREDLVDSHSFTKCNNAQQGDTINLPKDAVNNEILITSKSKGEKNKVVHITEPGTEIHHGTFKMNDDLLTPAVNLPQIGMDLKRDERVLKALKPVQSKERTSDNCGLRANIKANQQSFNILAHKDQSIQNRNKSKSNPKYSSLSKQVKDKPSKSSQLVTSRETISKVKSKPVSVKAAHSGTGISSQQKKVIDHARSRRASPEKLSNNRAQQQQPVRELSNNCQLKRPDLEGTPRSKSAVDFITYKDMFQQIQSGDEGPAIYEMFAGPIYDNLRLPSSSDRVKRRQVQSAKVKHRPLKQAQSKLKRSPGEKLLVSVKSKSKIASSRMGPLLTPVPRKDPHKVKDMPKLDEHREALLVLSEEVNIFHNSAQEKAKNHRLSIIEEFLSGHGSETPDDKTLTTNATFCNAGDKSHKHLNMHEKNVNLSIGNSNQSVSEPVLSKQLKINTWTSSSSSSSGHTIMSPVYQRFLDEVGDGPLTDDLLQCLAEELISLDEREIYISPSPENLEPSEEELNKVNDLSRRNTSPGVKCFHNHNMIWL